MLLGYRSPVTPYFPHYKCWDIIPRPLRPYPGSMRQNIPNIGSLLCIAHELNGKGGRKAAEGSKQAWKGGGSQCTTRWQCGNRAQVSPSTSQAASPTYSKYLFIPQILSHRVHESTASMQTVPQNSPHPCHDFWQLQNVVSGEIFILLMKQRQQQRPQKVRAALVAISSLHSSH